MSTATTSIQSQGNTPQAKDDAYGWGVDDLLHAGVLSGNVLTLDVIANDSGGKGKSLWSLDDGNGHTAATDYDLVAQDVGGVYENTATNNLGVCDSIAIVDGKVSLDLSHSLAKLGISDVSAMRAGDSIHDTFVYAIRLGNNGTLSQATVTVDIWGQNGSATIAGTATGTTSEDAVSPVTGCLVVNDPNAGECHTIVASGTTAKGIWSVDADGNWCYQVNNAAENHLAAGAHDSDSFTVTSLDGSACQTVAIDIVGANDPALISGTDTGAVTEDAVLSASGQLLANDPDDGESAFVPASLSGVFGSLALDAAGNWTYTLDNTFVQPLATSDHFTDSFQVHSLDGTQHTISIAVNGDTDPDTDSSNDFDTVTGTATGPRGTQGNDVLVGTDGIDGSAGTINGGPGNDAEYALGGNDILLGGLGADKLYGQAGDDTITGGGGSDLLFGGSGNDTLEGGGGNGDVLWGGSGNDVFRYTATADSVGAGSDLIADFHHGCDRIDVSAIDANAGDPGDTAFAWGGSAATAHGVWFSESGGNTVLHFDTDGNVASDEMTITLSGTGLWLSAVDFVL